MKITNRFLPFGIIGVTLLFACTTTRISRNPASDTRCAIDDERVGDDLRFEKFVRNLKRHGAIAGDDARKAVRWDATERRVALALAVGQAYAYGEQLLTEVDLRFDKGETVESLTRSREANSENPYLNLLALRDVKEQLLKVLLNEIRAEVHLYERKDWSQKRYHDAVAVFMTKYLEEVNQALYGNDRSARHLYDLFLADVLNLADRLLKFTETCDVQYLDDAASLHVDRDAEHATKFRAQMRDYIEKLTPRKDRPGFEIEKIVRAQSIRMEVESSGPDRSPQGETRAFYPSTNSHGNITGSNFAKGVWALTYDDGPAKTTPTVLENLKKHGMKATFFILSQQIVPHMFAETALREKAEGNAVACHSYTHAQVPKLSAAGRDKEINKAADVFASVFRDRPVFYRLPYGAGASVPSVREMIAKGNMIHVFWNVDTLDWQDKNPATIVARAKKQMASVGNHGIILFHDIHPQSVVASEILMGYLKDPANRICTVTLPQVVDKMNADATGAPSSPLCP